MVDTTRAHERVPDRPHPGIRSSIDGILPEPVHLFVPRKLENAADCALLIHFHGAPFAGEHAAHAAPDGCALAAVNLGAGSGVYERPFSDPAVFEKLVAAAKSGVAPAITRILLSAFSAGYGAVRAILRHHPDAADGVILLDGLHTGYIPDATPLADGGCLEASELEPFLALARRAVAGERSFLVTHSEVFPGTFASTTECADHLIRELGLRRTPVLCWGPLGMQQLSQARRGRFAILGFAGNTAPDHVDHLHALFHFLGHFDP